jgi:hypothetical protein
LLNLRLSFGVVTLSAGDFLALFTAANSRALTRERAYQFRDRLVASTNFSS